MCLNMNAKMAYVIWKPVKQDNTWMIVTFVNHVASTVANVRMKHYAFYAMTHSP